MNPRWETCKPIQQLRRHGAHFSPHGMRSYVICERRRVLRQNNNPSLVVQYGALIVNHSYQRFDDNCVLSHRLRFKFFLFQMESKIDNENAYGALLEHEQSELNACQQNINLFTKYISDYESLKKLLSTLTDKTRYDIMVPIAGSKLAFMPGYMHHTNEVLVLIGDNYFVEKSTKEAIEFVERRIAFCNEKIEELQNQRQMLHEWLSVTAGVKSDTTNLVDISETWSEHELETWKIKHRQSVQEERKKASAKPNSDIDINQILDKYEKEENTQMKLVSEEDMPTPPCDEISTLSISEKELKTPKCSSPVEPIEYQVSNRPVSKFKASRMKR